MRIDAEIFNKPTMSRKEQIDTAFERTESELIIELTEADCIEEVYDLIYNELVKNIQHYKLVSIDPEDVLPHFWKVYGLKSCS